MSPGVEPGFCDLECWCHVPTRGLNKPPCYLCVIECCSLSTKKNVTPSAPELSPTDERHQPNYSSQTVYSEGLSSAGASSRASRYGWRSNGIRSSSLDTGRVNEIDHQDFRESFVQIPSEDNTNPLNDFAGPPQVNERPESPVHELIELEAPETNQDQDAGMVEVNASVSMLEEDNPEEHITTIEVQPNAVQDTDTDLAERIRHIVVQDFDTTDDDEKSGGMPGRHSRTGMRTPTDRNKTRRRRDKYQGLYNFNVNTTHCFIPRASISSHNSASTSSIQNESEFQRLHKIHRRDTTVDAARRYLQSDENLHRTWMREVAVRRRNYPKKNWFTKKHDGNIRSMFS